MWLVKQIKKYPYYAVAGSFILGTIAYFILPLLAVVSLLSVGITVGICLVGGVSLGALLGWFIERKEPAHRVFSLQPEQKKIITRIVMQKHHEEKKKNIASTSSIQRVFNTSTGGPTIILSGYLATKDQAVLASSSASLRTLFSPFLTDLKNKKVRQLLQYVVYGNEEKAQALLDRYPHFLFCIETVVDYSSRKIRGTAYQIALGAEDIEMAKMMQPYFILACGDEEKAQTEIAKQYNAQFTPASKAQEEKDAAADQAALDQVIQAIHQATEEECEILLTLPESKEGEVKEIATALKQFRSHLDKKTEEVIITGKHFNMQLLVNALNLNHDKNYAVFGIFTTDKNRLFGRQVIGYIQRYLPACYAQAFCQGMCYVVKHDIPYFQYGNPLVRSLKFKFKSASYDYSSHFFPLDQNNFWWGKYPHPFPRLGYDYACDVDKMQGPAYLTSEARGINHPLGEAFSKLMSRKKREMTRSCRTLTPPGQTRVLAP